MRLLTHNLLQCNKKGVTNGFPLIIRPTKIKYEESPFDKDFTVAMIPKLEYSALLKALQWVQECPGVASGDALPPSSLPQLPGELPGKPEDEEGFLRQLHTALFDLHLVEGHLARAPALRDRRQRLR
ncbi:unnamed protein product [Prorocentrum cordatum]|uniref:Uncharacterized protein n=1 Tax=Prorocentrum cordatum TaxID=2364126 RepID=A0ABN9USK1_9DINO|nr:unnamed protein product [Polarella glacialis]